MLWTINILYNEKNEVSSIKSIARDITDRKKTEKALRQSQATLSSIFKAAPIGIGMVKERVISFVNDQMIHMTGYSQNEITGKSAVILYPSREEFENVGEKKYDLISRYGTGTVETCWKRKNGDIINILLSSTPINPKDLSMGVTFTALDITKRKHAEMELKRSEAFLAATFSSMQDGISVLDKNLVIQKVNPKMEEWYPDQAPLVGKKCHTCYCSSSKPCDSCPSIRAIQSGQTEFAVIPGPSESPMEWLEVFSYPIKDHDTNKTSGVVAFVRDITGRVRSEKELEKYREHLEDIVEERTYELKRANKALEKARHEAEKANILKSEFIANISHEIRTPLNAVTGFSELLTAIVEDEKQKSYLDAIKNAGNNLLTLINDILDLSKIEAGKINIEHTPVRIRTILKEIGQIFTLQLTRKGIKLITDIDPQLPEALQLDEIRLRQVLLNIVGNAVKFTETGYIKICVKMVEQDLHIQIKDTGIGIPENDIDSIFDSFKQQSGQDLSRFSGTGLGLTISKRLLGIMNGTICVESQVGQGSIFKIIIQGVDVSSWEIPILKDLPEMKDTCFKKGKVLVVDDIESNRLLLKELLVKVNLDVLMAENGHEAIVICPEYQPDIVLMDLRMPVMDGFEAARQLKKGHQTQNIPVLAVTAAAMDKGEIDILQHGFAGFLSKPIEINTLLLALSKYFEKDDSVKHHKKHGRPVAAPSLSSNTCPFFPEILSILESDFIPKWKEFQRKQPIHDVKAFGDELILLGMKYELEYLVEYANQLILHVGNYDIDSMRSAITQFPDTLKTIKKMMRGAL